MSKNERDLEESYARIDDVGTLGMQEELKKYGLEQLTNQRYNKIGADDVPLSEIDEQNGEDLIVTNKILTIDGTIDGIDKSIYHKVRYSIININSLQRELYKEILLEETVQYNSLGINRDAITKIYYRGLVIITSDDLNNEHVISQNDVPRPYITNNNGDIIYREYLYRSPDNYHIDLPTSYNNVKSIRLLSSEVPNTLNPVNQYNNMIIFDLWDSDMNLNVPVDPLYPFPYYIIQIPTSNYTLTSLASAIQNAINTTVETSSIYNFSNIVTVSAETESGEFKITLNQQVGHNLLFHLRFWETEGITRSTDLWSLLGFSAPFEYDILGDPLYTTERTNLYDFGQNIHANSVTTDITLFRNLKPFRFPDLQPNKYIYLVLEGDNLSQGTIPTRDIVNPKYTRLGITKIFAKVQLSVDPNATAYNTYVSNPIIFEKGPLPKLESLVIRWLDYAGREVDFCQRDHSFALELSQYIDKLTVNDFSSHRGRTDESKYVDTAFKIY